MTERELPTCVEQVLCLGRWRYMHIHNSRRSAGAGWPDVFCVRNGEAIALELKTAGRRISDSQTGWLAELDACGIETRIVHPNDLDALTARLLRRNAA
jgi:VRR-NUC domain